MRQRNQAADEVLVSGGRTRGRNPGRWGAALSFFVGLMLLSGCDLGIEPDSLVRELRILGMRVSTGDPAAKDGTVADLQAQVGFGAGGLDVTFTTSTVTLSGLVIDPNGPGRRIAAPRPLQHDFYLCVGLRSLYSPGSLDPECRKWGPSDPDPQTNKSLVYLNNLGSLAADGASLTLPTDVLKAVLLTFLQTALSGGQGSPADMAGGSGLPMRPQVILLPVLLRSSVVGGDRADNRNNEVGYNYLRVVIAIPALGITLPPPNHNPVLTSALIGPQAEGTQQLLLPCAGGATACPAYAMPRAAAMSVTGWGTYASREVYNPIDDSDRKDVPETLRFSWFASDGEFTELRTQISRAQTQWKAGEKYAPAASLNTVRLWLVVQDERGGTDWHEYNLQLQ